MRHSAHCIPPQKTKRRRRSDEIHCCVALSLSRICRLAFLFIHKMRDHAVSAQGMILIINILHDLPITDWVESLLHVLLVALIKSVPEQGYHRHADGLIVSSILLQLLRLPPVLPCDDSNRQHTHLLNPVFLYRFHNQFPVQRHPFFHILYSDPAAPAIVIRNALNPCSSIAVPHCTLHPCSVVAVPDRRIHVRHRHSNAGYACIVAGISAGRRGLTIVDNQH